MTQHTSMERGTVPRRQSTPSQLSLPRSRSSFSLDGFHPIKSVVKFPSEGMTYTKLCHDTRYVAFWSKKKIQVWSLMSLDRYDQSPKKDSRIARPDQGHLISDIAPLECIAVVIAGDRLVITLKGTVIEVRGTKRSCGWPRLMIFQVRIYELRSGDTTCEAIKTNVLHIQGPEALSEVISGLNGALVLRFDTHILVGHIRFVGNLCMTWNWHSKPSLASLLQITGRYRVILAT